MGIILYLQLYKSNYNVSILVFLLVSYVLLSISLYLLFPKAGVDAVKGLIPGVNFVEWCKLIGRKPVYALLLLVPIVNIFIFCGMAVDLVRSFGQLEFKDTALAVLYAPAAFFKAAKDDSIKYVEPILPAEAAYMAKINEARQGGNKFELQKLVNKNPYSKAPWREWVESLFFAVFAAAFIRMFLIEAFVIPTSSMEGSLNVGDFLFVSKAHYGVRTPMTVAQIPLLHNRIPFINTESYLKKPSLDYHRLPALENIKRNRPFVFNWPVGDSVYLTSRRSYAASQITQDPDLLKYDRELAQKVRSKDLISRPMDKTDFYIKRCVALPGDSLQVIDGSVYIDGKKAVKPVHRQFLYIIELPDGSIVNRKILDKNGIDFGDMAQRQRSGVFPNGKNDILYLDDEQVQFFKDNYPGVKIKKYPQVAEPSKFFPNDPQNFKTWTVDNYGPIWIPQAGATVQIGPKNIALYRRIINVYEDNDLEEKGGRIFINGKAATSYTFKQNYYWAMGDNRHASEDSRMWGFVPEDHIVGKPLFVFFSTKEGSIGNGINWDRLFMSANKGLESDK